MTSTGIRKIFFWDYFHYKSAVSTFDNTTTVVWTAPGANAWEAWDTVFGGTEALGTNYIVPGAVAGAPSYLRSVTTITPGRTLSGDYGADTNSATADHGVYVMAAGTNLAVSSYRIRLAVNAVVVERLDAGGAVAWSETFAYNPSASWNYIRWHFYPVNFYFTSGEVLATCAGQWVVEAGSSDELMVQLAPSGSGIDPSPRTTGSYHGIYQGNGSQPKVTKYLVGEDFYALRKSIEVKHGLFGMSMAHLLVLRGDYDEWGRWERGNFVQIYAYDMDESNPVVFRGYNDFMGELAWTHDVGTGKGSIDADNKVILTFCGPTKQLDFSGDDSSHTGDLTDYVEKWLEEPGGNHWSGFTVTFGSALYKLPKYLNKLFVKGGAVSVTNRAFRGKSIISAIKEIALAEDFYVFMTPECALKVTDVWRDMTSVVLDTSGNRTMYVRGYLHDLTQTVNQADVYLAGGTKRSTPTPNAASQTAYGIRQGHPEAQYVDLQIQDNAEADAVAQTLHDRHYADNAQVDVYLLARYMNLRPGDLISFSCPQLQIGGDYNTPHANWVPETWAIMEKDWDSDRCLIHFRLCPSWDDVAKGVTKGRLDPMLMARDTQLKLWHRGRKADESHL